MAYAKKTKKTKKPKKPVAKKPAKRKPAPRPAPPKPVSVPSTHSIQTIEPRFSTWNDWSANKLSAPAYNRLTPKRYAEVLEQLLIDHTFEEIETIARHGEQPALIAIVARSIVVAKKFGKYRELDKMLDRVIGKAPTEMVLHDGANSAGGMNGEPVSFEYFCANAGYPAPYPKQIEMSEWALDTPGVHMLLGSRNYGKTDYITMLGVAYRIYLNPRLTFLIMTKSKERNTSIMTEIASALEKNSVVLSRASAITIRVAGKEGKENTVSSLTMGSSVRGRHPDVVVMDDPLTDDDNSEATRKRVFRKYEELTKLTPNILIIGQPVHKFDLYEELRTRVPVMEVTHGTIPELDHDLQAQRLAGVSEESISANYHLKIISTQGYPFEKISWLDDFPLEHDGAVAFVDPSFQGGDFTAMTSLVGYFENVAIAGRCWKKAWYDCIDVIVEECLRRNVKRICVETNSLGDQPVVLLREFLDQHNIGVVGKYSNGFKHARISSAGPYASKIYLARTSDFDYQKQVTKYEYGADFDDGPDSLASCLEWVGLIHGKGEDRG